MKQKLVKLKVLFRAYNEAITDIDNLKLFWLDLSESAAVNLSSSLDSQVVLAIFFIMHFSTSLFFFL